MVSQVEAVPFTLKTMERYGVVDLRRQKQHVQPFDTLDKPEGWTEARRSRRYQKGHGSWQWKQAEQRIVRNGRFRMS